jgi:hypothetical protein
MKIKILLNLIPILMLGKDSTAQSFAGDWKGTSLCQVKNSPCHDENVVYHILKTNSSNLYQVNAGKIINGKEDDMGPLVFTFDPEKKVLFSADSEKQSRWEFKLTGNKMHGMMIVKGNLLRIVDLIREDQH